MNTLRLFVFLASLIGSFEILYAATDSSNNLFETEAKDEITTQEQFIFNKDH
jgi:hypothetical protein